MPHAMAHDTSRGPVEAWFFDGRTSQSRAVILSVEGQALYVREKSPEGEEGKLLVQPIPVSFLAVDEPLGNTRRIDILPSFSDNQAVSGNALGSDAYCEARESPALEAMLAAMGYRAPLAMRWQRSLRGAIAAFVGMLLVLPMFYFWGLPPLADGVARLVPDHVTATLDTAVIDSLEKTRVLLPSRLRPEERQEIQGGLEKLIWPGKPAEWPRLKLSFYSAPGIGANAFALPGGTVVVTDEMVKLSAGSPGVLAVLGHEAGHVVHRHGVRHLVEASVIGLAVGLWVGDFSSMATALTTLALQNNYSRGHEQDADDYGVEVMELSGMSPGLLADMLEKLEQAHRERHARDNADAHVLEKALSSHPETAERIRRIRGRT